MKTVAAATAMTILVKKGLTESLKDEALRLADMYSSNIQIQIDIRQEDGIAKMRITEYDV
jgi:hypothetical protein